MLAIVNQIRGLGYELKDDEVASKVMRSLSSRFDHVVTSIVEAIDVSQLSLNELSGSLQAHEARFHHFGDGVGDKVFVLKRASSSGCGTGGCGEHWRGRGRSFDMSSRGAYNNEQRRQQLQSTTHTRQFEGPRQFGRQAGGQRSGRGSLQNV